MQRREQAGGDTICETLRRATFKLLQTNKVMFGMIKTHGVGLIAGWRRALTLFLGQDSKYSLSNR